MKILSKTYGLHLLAITALLLSTAVTFGIGQSRVNAQTAGLLDSCRDSYSGQAEQTCLTATQGCIDAVNDVVAAAAVNLQTCLADVVREVGTVLSLECAAEGVSGEAEIIHCVNNKGTANFLENTPAGQSIPPSAVPAGTGSGAAANALGGGVQQGVGTVAEGVPPANGRTIAPETRDCLDTGVSIDGTDNQICKTENIQDNPIIRYLTAGINFLTAGVGVVTTGAIVVGGIRYITSRGNPQATASAVKIISNAVIAIIGYVFGYAFLNWIIPGGLL